MAWNVMDALNKNVQAAAADSMPKARFRTKDISIHKIYGNEANFYSMTDIEQLAQDIYAVGLLENITVVHAPCEKGDYRLIAGERRWRALNLLVKKGHRDFEVVTCQVKSPAEENEEMVQLIIANTYRNKSVKDILEEEQKLKETLQYMKSNGLKLQGYELDSGRLRDVIAEMLQIPATKIAQIESINKRLSPQFTEELKEGRLTFSAAYEISGMDEEIQAEMLERYQENGLTFKEVKEFKRQQEEKKAAEQIPGQMTLRQEDMTQKEEDVLFQEEEKKTGEAVEYGQKTAQQLYDEEQAAIDRETRRKLREREEAAKMQELPSEKEKKVHVIKLGSEFFGDVKTGVKNFELRKNDRDYKAGELLEIHEYKNGEATGRICNKLIGYVLKEYSGLQEGYCILGLRDSVR